MASEVEDGRDDAFATDGKADGGMSAAEVAGVLALVNSSSAAQLKADAGVTKRVATNIVTHRDGVDAQAGTADDDRYDTLAELDAIPYVGPTTLQALLDAAKDRGLVTSGAKIDVIFSPQPAASSHNARIAQLIRGAQKSVDIAIYSYSDAGVSAALADAVTRGIKVRFLFETANDDRKVVDPTLRAITKSGKLEAQGVDVRYVNKILHHKFLIVDGPRDDKSRAATTKLVTGSANWSSTGATVYDENTMFIEGSAELGAAFQHEFDKLWVGSRSFDGPAAAQGPSSADIKPSDVADEPGIGLFLTSPNFKPTGVDGTTWSVNKDSTVVSNEWVTAIANAQHSIHIASGHMRLRPVAEALIAKKAADPGVEIEVYLDQQEFISASGHAAQVAEVAACEAAATTPAQHRDCRANDFLFSRALVDAGIDVRFKSFAYRWDASYAAQMHSKYMVVDGSELISGSYNLSTNSEQATFENALHVTGPQFGPLLGSFEQNFETIWETGRADNLLSGLRNQVSTSSTIPLTFPPMSLTYQELEALRAHIRSNCAAADSPDYRANPSSHKVCPR